MRRFVVVVAGALLLCTGVAADARKKPRPRLCPGGRFVVHGERLVASDAAGRLEAVVVEAGHVAVSVGCPLVRAKMKPGRKGTRVAARWRACEGLAGRVALKGTIDESCGRLAGTLRVGRRSRSFEARLTSCGDGIVDPNAPAPEGCEGDAACGAGRRCVACTCVAAPRVGILGPEADRANEHIPDMVLAAAAEREFTVSGGIPISRRTLGILFRDTATVAEANRLLVDLDAEVVGGEPLIRLLVVALRETTDLAGMMAVLEQLAASPAVAVAAPNVAGVSRMLPPHHGDQAGNGWTWETTRPPPGSNNGLELVRAPQMWNLRTYAQRWGQPADLGIIDGGIDSLHPDLVPRVVLPLPGPAGAPVADHGTHVAGIMAAWWGDQRGVEGVAFHDPMIHARAYNGGDQYSVAAHLQDLQTLYREILAPHPAVVAVNESFGLARYAAGVNPQVDPVAPPSPMTYAQLMDSLGTIFHLSAEMFGAGTRSNFLIAAAVGYDAQPGVVRVQDDSPMSNASVRFPGGHTLAVEAVDRANRYDRQVMEFNLGGTVSAPGYGVRSAEAAGGLDWEDELDDGTYNGSATDGDTSWATAMGTSMATPHVSGLIAALWHLDSRLTFGEVRELLTDPRFTVPTVGGTRPRIDAFAAAMGIDLLLGDRALQRALVDVDDGTLDGNQRRWYSSGADYPLIDTADRRRGDGSISMRDFRAFRDALARAMLEERRLAVGSVLLDGSVTHFKKDLNMDGCVAGAVVAPPHPGNTVPAAPGGCAGAPAENVFPRYDFNGDGQVSPDARVGGPSSFPAFKGNAWSDFEVLADLWPNDPDPEGPTEGWSAAELMNLVPGLGGGSADLTIESAVALGAATDFDEVRLTIPGLPMTRTLRAGEDPYGTPRLVWTVPIGQALAIEAAGYKGGTRQATFCTDWTPRALLHAQDVTVHVSTCGSARFSHMGLDGPYDWPTAFWADANYGSPHVADPPPRREEYYGYYSGSGDFPGRACASIAVGDTCTYDMPVLGTYSGASLHGEVRHVEANHWLLALNTTLAPEIPPLLPSPVSCGDRYQGAIWGCATYAYDQVAATLEVDTGLSGRGRIAVWCVGGGDHVESSSVASPTFFESFLGRSGGTCGGVSQGAPWSVDASDSYDVDTLANPLRLALYAGATAYLGIGSETITWAHAVDATITVDVTITPLP